MSESKLVKLIAPLPRTRRGYGQHLSTLSKDGDRIIYGSGWSVFWRSLEDMSVCDSFTYHREDVRAVSASPNGVWIASGDVAGNLKCWELKFKDKTPKLETGVLGCVNDIGWDPESKRVVCVGDGNPLKGRAVLRDGGNSVGSVEKHSKELLAVAVKPQRPYRVATAGEDLLVNFSNAFPVKFQKTHSGKHTRYPNCIRYAPDGSVFITVGSDSKINVFEGKTGEFQREISDKAKGHKAAIYSFSFSPDSKKILTASADKTAKIWDVESGAVEISFDFNSKSKDFRDMLVSTFWHKGAKEFLGVLAMSGAIIFLDPSNPDAPARVIEGVNSTPTAVVADRKGGCFYVGGNQGDITQFDMKTHHGRWIKGDGHGKCIVKLAVAGPELVSVGWDNTVRWTDTAKCEYTASATLPSQPTDVAVGKKDPNLVIAAVRKGALLVFLNKELVHTETLDFEPLGVSINADDSEVTVSGKDKGVHFFAIEGKKLAKKEVEKETNRKAVIFASAHPTDPNTVMVMNAAKEILCFQGHKCKNPSGWEYHNAALKTGAWSPSGKRFASGSMDETVIVWHDFEKFRSAARLEIGKHFQGVTALDWWDEDTLIVACYDMSIKIWTVGKYEAK